MKNYLDKDFSCNCTTIRATRDSSDVRFRVPVSQGFPSSALVNEEILVLSLLCSGKGLLARLLFALFYF
jgi:hypothetical protein